MRAAGQSLDRTTDRPRLARWLSVAVWTAWIASLALALLGLVEALPSGLANAGFSAVALLLILSTVTVGAVLVTRVPRNIVGWLLLAGGLSAAVFTGAAAVADYGLNLHPGSVPGAVWFAVFSVATRFWFIGPLAGLVPLYFPTGRLLSRRWRTVIGVVLVAVVGSTLGPALSPFLPGTYPMGLVNPLATGGTGVQLGAILTGTATIVGIPALLLVTASLVVRYRRARDIERQQLKWFALVGLVFLPTVIVAFFTTGFTSGPLADISNAVWAMAILGLALMPVAIGLAVLRYRLYEIDRIISRTIGYGVLTLILAGLFVAVILLAQDLLAPFTGSNELAVAGSTLVVYALFQPLRRRVQRLVDQRFNRTRYDAERTVADFTGRLRDQVDLETLRAEIVATVVQAVEPTSVSLWLRE
jgi:hypothetical protein